MWISVLSLLFLASAKDPNPWGRLSTPVRTEHASIYGSYTSGCLTNAETLPLKGVGYEVVNPYRNRYYAHGSLVRLLKNWGIWAQSSGLGKIVIGDLAQPAGGPLTGAHRSHQIGLDADIRLHVLPPTSKIKNQNNFNSVDVVTCKNQKSSLAYSFKNSKWPVSSTQLLKKIASEDVVERVFVSAGIKKYLCESFPDHPEWLRKIRPEWGHTGHMHVRLRCPMGMSSCNGQSPVQKDPTDPTGVGCAGNDYASWFQPKPQISKTCLPKSEKEDTPYWQKVITSTTFPTDCKQLLIPKPNTTASVSSNEI